MLSIVVGRKVVTISLHLVPIGGPRSGGDSYEREQIVSKLVVIRSRDDLLPMRSLTIGAKYLAPLKHGDIKLVSVDESPKIQVGIWIYSSESIFHRGTASQMNKAIKMVCELFATRHML